MTKGLIRQVLCGVVLKHGFARTNMTTGNVAGQRFVEKLGFQRVDEKDGTETWELRLR
jgi:hypothetical protein